MIACRIVAAATCFVVLYSASASGQGAAPPPPITSNRPGIGDSEALVGRGVVQLELGIQTQVTRFGGERDWTTDWGQSTLRVGFVDAVEVHVSWGGVAVDRVAETGSTRIVTGATDLFVGAKIALLDESRHFLTLTASPATSVPIGGDDFSSGSYDGALRLLWARSLPKDWDLSGNILFLITTDANRRYWENLITTSIGRSLSSSTSVFAELATGLADPRVWTLDAGGAWVPRPNLQWDVSSGVLVRGPGRSWFLSVGLTLRRLPRPSAKSTTTMSLARSGTLSVTPMSDHASR